MKKLYFALFWWLTLPHVLVYKLLSRPKVSQDLEIWRKRHQVLLSQYLGPLDKLLGNHNSTLLAYLLITRPEYRNLFYKRMGIWSLPLRYLPELSSLYINTPNQDISGGLYIEHGFSTIINARSIGANCWINQQVTIGSSSSKSIGTGDPIIEDNVKILTGAIVIGKINVGSHAIVGAGAIVVRDIPSHTLVVMPKPVYKSLSDTSAMAPDNSAS